MIKIEQWVTKKQKGKGVSPFKALLYFFSLFYQTAVWIRHLLYRCKVFKQEKVSIPVISIGNIVCGGTGKSEFVYKLLSDLNRDDVAILSRGYRSKRKGGSRFVCDSDDGDEPFMLKQRLKNVPVIVGKRREESARLAKNAGAKAVFLDDGMQYLSLKKDIQVILVRADQPFGGGFVPYGMRREIISELKVADYIIIHGAESQKKYELVKRSLLCYSDALCFGTQYCLEKNKKLIGTKVGVFCGVGNPQFFMKGLQSLGARVITKKILADHEKILDLKAFCDEAKSLGAEVVVCTTKDYVKLSPEEKALVEPVEVDMKISYEAEAYNNLVTTIVNNIEG